MKSEEKMEVQYMGRLSKLMGNKTQKEKEEVLSGEKYILEMSLAQAKEQIIYTQRRIDTIAKFAIVDNKLAFNGTICEDPIS